MNRDNNFNLMRIVAALAVLVSHSFTIVLGDANSEPLNKLLGVSLGSIAVDMFFACSGFLVCASYINRRSLTQFIRARALRVMPALLVMLALTVICIGVFVSEESLPRYFSDSQTLVYISKNLFLFAGAEYSLVGVFQDNPYPSVVNGSLWTLPHEVRAYAALAVMCWVSLYFFSKKQMLRIFALVCILFLGIDSLSLWLGFSVPLAHFVHLFGVFLLGAVLYLCDMRTSRWLISSTCLSLMAIVAIAYSGLFEILHAWLIPIVTVGLAHVSTKQLYFYNRFGDYSYGIYIYAFPIQQALVFYHPNISVYLMIFSAAVLSMMAAYLSWHLVEKPCLAFK